jgi:uncharacterized protein (TIGR02266 family)
MSDPSPPTASIVDEFMSLNRRRLFGAPPLGVADLERWQALRRQLADRFGAKLDGLLSVVERRAHFRFPTHLEVRFETAGDLRSACLRDISEGGLFIVTEDPLPVDAPLRLWIRAPGGTVTVAGRVAWKRPHASAGDPAGMGVRFEGLDEGQRAQIRAAVAAVEPESGHA